MNSIGIASKRGSDIRKHMNWQEVDFDWNQVRAFLATAEAGSFSAAARALSTTQPTITRQIAGLEKSLQLTLFERSTRGLTMTEAGGLLFEHVKDMGGAASRISMVAQGFNTDIAGEVSITAVDFVCVQFLIEAIRRLKKQAPNLRIKVLASDEVQDLRHRDADIAIRHVRPQDPELMAKLIANWSASFHASPAYIEQSGLLIDGKNADSAEIVGPRDPVPFQKMCADLGIDLRLEQFTMPTTSALVAYEMVREGLGVGIVAENVARNDPQMKRIWPHVPAFDFPVWLVTHRELHTSKKIRLVFDVLERVLKQA